MKNIALGPALQSYAGNETNYTKSCNGFTQVSYQEMPDKGYSHTNLQILMIGS